MLDFFTRYYGAPYPFHSAGGIVPRLDVGYSLETATKPTYAFASKPTEVGPDLLTIAHENAHQWFGDSVTPAQWRDIWLSEGMAEFSSWLWVSRHAGGPSPRTLWRRQYRNFADTKANRGIFDFNAMYTRGAMVLEAIREIAGDRRFRTIQRTWLTEHAYRTATTREYVALVKRLTPALSPARWDAFFAQWLYRSYPGVPSKTNRPQVIPATFRR
jgi:aminopeptidase N